MPTKTPKKKSAAPPRPDIVFATLSGYQRTEALKAAIDLDLFTAIDDGARTSGQVAGRIGAAERGARILCDYLVVIGLLRKAAGRYALTPESAAFLSRNSPKCIAPIAGFMCSPNIADHFKDLARTVRRGGAAPDKTTLAPEHPAWVDFARSMVPMMALPAKLIADLLEPEKASPLEVLDIAAGHGVFGIALAQRNAEARVCAVDWAPVLQVAMENAATAGLGARYRTIAGSAFDVDFGGGYDVALLTNFLHHFDARTIVSLLKKVKAALKPGGRAVALEFVPNEDRVTPPQPAGFALTMLGSTPAGDAYTFSEYRAMFREAGFSKVANHPLPPTPESAVVAS